MFEEYDLVETLVTREGYPAGTRGVIVGFYSTGPACEVEVWDETDYPMGVATYLLTELRRIEDQ